MPPDRLTITAEAAEAAGNAALFQAASPQLREELGIEVRDIDGATCWITRGLDRRFANGVVGLGLQKPATPEALDRIEELYAESGVHFTIHVTPGSEPTELAVWLRERGFRVVNQGVKCWRVADRAGAHTSDFWIQQVGRAQAEQFLRLALHDFDMGELRDALRATIGSRQWRHYVAFDGQLPIASAAMYLHQRTAWLGWAYTLPDHRRKGAQSGLLARRVRDAFDRGCSLLVAETGKETSESPNHSLRNMLRMGFRVAYVKEVYSR